MTSRGLERKQGPATDLLISSPLFSLSRRDSRFPSHQAEMRDDMDEEDPGGRRTEGRSLGGRSLRLTAEILLGFELGTGKPVYLPLNHTIICGMTQLSGKTTTLEALLSRSKLTALTFRTKRGELGFETAHRTPLYFNEQGLLHWQALEGLLDTTLQEKVRREPGVRAALMNLSRAAKSMQEIYERNETALANPRLRGFMHDVHTKLKGYFDLIIPQLRELQPRLSTRLELQPGMNMMDLEGLNEEMQALLLAAATNEIYAHAKKTIIVIPEAWKFLPQDHGSPCKAAVLAFLKEGAIIGNYLWVDTQDLRTFDKRYTRSFDNWVLGRQRDRREVEEVMNAIPLPKQERPPPEEIMRFPLGVFLACLHNDVRRVYVQPAWLSEEEAKKVALGNSQPRHEPAPPPVRKEGTSKLRRDSREGLVEAPVAGPPAAPPSQPTAVYQAPPPHRDQPSLGQPLPERPLEPVVQQTVPNWTLVKYRPSWILEAALRDTPPSALARVLVVLADTQIERDSKWSEARIKRLISDRTWPLDGVDDAINQLVRADTLRRGGGYLRFFRERVQVVESSEEVTVS